MKITWSASQEQFKKKRLADKCAKKQQYNDYVTKLLVACKSWGGPCTSKEELVMQKHADLTKQIVNNELSYYVHTHPEERAFHPEYFTKSRFPLKKKLKTCACS